MDQFFEEAMYQYSPLRALTELLAEEEAKENARQYEGMRFVGYVLEIGFDDVTLITSDPFKRAVGGVPRGSFLIMAPDSLAGLPPHFTLLRVKDAAPTPLAKEVQQTYFELHKKSMPELDIWTKNELQWGAFKASVLGMFYPDPNSPNKKVAFSGDVNNIVSAHRYKVYAPTDALLNLIINGTVRETNRFPIGELRFTECKLPFREDVPQPKVKVEVSTDDFRGFRTAMFGKTRLGKSNVVKIIAQSIIETTKDDHSVGQLIFDINGEYANDNPQDDSASIRSRYEDECVVYALTDRPSTPSEPLRLNFYEQPESCISVLASLLAMENRNSQYIKSFTAVKLPSIADVADEKQVNTKLRALRKVQIYWAILSKAGFKCNENSLKRFGLFAGKATTFNPGFSADLRQAALGKGEPSSPPSTLGELQVELEKIADFRRRNEDSEYLTTGSGNPLFDADDVALLEFLNPSIGGGPRVLRPFMTYHDPNAGDVVSAVLKQLDTGKTVILDLGNASDDIRRYFSDLLSRAVFSHQEEKFTSNKLGNHFVQLYFEEAHNLFPRDDTDLTDVYARFAKEGAKFHIGMVYSTQSPSTINRDLLAQTENFFVAHMSSQDEANALAKLQVAFDGLQQDILRTRTPGYMRMITFSHRFVVPVQVYKFEAGLSTSESKSEQYALPIESVASR